MLNLFKDELQKKFSLIIKFQCATFYSDTPETSWFKSFWLCIFVISHTRHCLFTIDFCSHQKVFHLLFHFDFDNSKLSSIPFLKYYSNNSGPLFLIIKKKHPAVVPLIFCLSIGEGEFIFIYSNDWIMSLSYTDQRERLYEGKLIKDHRIRTVINSF